jgi:methylated-DNA-[protein]-cysteine S-methyltransferase
MLHLAASTQGICRLSIGVSERQFTDELARSTRTDDWRRNGEPVLREAARQLGEYFRGERRDFLLPLDLMGTPFQLRVWRALLRIPYAETRNYADLAREIGSPSAARAVGSANGANPVAIIVPCHRVIASGGDLGGYSAGLDFKKKLLALESGAA